MKGQFHSQDSDLDEFDFDGILGQHSMYESYAANRSLLENFSIQTKKKNNFQLFSPRGQIEEYSVGNEQHQPDQNYYQSKAIKEK